MASKLNHNSYAINGEDDFYNAISNFLSSVKRSDLIHPNERIENWENNEDFPFYTAEKGVVTFYFERSPAKTNRLGCSFISVTAIDHAYNALHDID